MKNMSTLNYKMADEIETLKTVIEQITSENNQMKIILEMKHTEWIEVEKNKASSTIKSTSVTSTPKSYAAVVSNSFKTLVDKHVTNESSNDGQTETSVESDNLNCPPENISSQSTIDQQSNKNESNVDNPNPIKKISSPPNVLLIGNSMVKHICQEKLSYAAKAKTTCKSYRGARIKEVHKNLQKDCGEGRTSKLPSIIVHVGTNDLVSDDVNTSVKEMEEVIVEAKLHAHNVAISSVVKRYDNKVPNSRVAHFNNLVHDLCKKHKITFIDNDNIDKSYLNRSNLHLNYNGDKALGKSLCSYLRSVKSRMSYTPDSHSLRQSRCYVSKQLLLRLY
jgi:hypothetical protein